MQSPPFPVLPAEQEALAERIAQLVLAHMADPAPLPEAVTVEQAMKMLSCDTRSAFYRELEDLGVRAYRPGKYRRNDIINAVARRSYAAARRAHGGRKD